MMQSSKVLGLFLLLARICGVGAKLNVPGHGSVAKPQEKLLEEEFLETVSGTRRKLYRIPVCQSDCDYDSDCRSGLICYQRSAGAPCPPCCPGSTPSDSRDFCVPASGCTAPSPAPPPPTSVDVGIIACFSGDTQVNVLEKGTISMKDLAVGDQILSSVNGKQHYYQTVYSFAHSHPTRVATFLVIHTEDGNSLQVTGDHLVYLKGKSNPVRASSIKAGDGLAPLGAVVTAIGTTEKAGIYAPLTPDGTFLLNGGVLVSSYAAVVPHDEYATFRNGQPFLAQHTGLHLAVTPYRMWCRVTASYCDFYNEDGMPSYVACGIHLLEWIHQQHPCFQVVWLAVAFLFFGTLFLLETIWFRSPALLLLLGLLGKVALRSKTSCSKSKCV